MLSRKRSEILVIICWYYPCQSASLQKCFTFVDGTAMETCRFKFIYQIIVYNEHKWIHLLNFQSLALPNGLIANFYGPHKGQHYHSTMLYEANLLNDLRKRKWFNSNFLNYLLGSSLPREFPVSKTELEVRSE